MLEGSFLPGFYSTYDVRNALAKCDLQYNLFNDELVKKLVTAAEDDYRVALSKIDWSKYTVDQYEGVRDEVKRSLGIDPRGPLVYHADTWQTWVAKRQLWWNYKASKSSAWAISFDTNGSIATIGDFVDELAAFMRSMEGVIKVETKAPTKYVTDTSGAMAPVKGFADAFADTFDILKPYLLWGAGIYLFIKIVPGWLKKKEN